MMVRTDHHGQEPAEPMAIALGYQLKSVERHRFYMRVTSVVAVLRCCSQGGQELRLRFPAD